jgi:hemolysin activation/secretion protein
MKGIEVNMSHGTNFARPDRVRASAVASRAASCLLGAALLGPCAAALAQPLPPDPGALQRGQQQQQDFLNSRPQAPQASPPVILDEQGGADLSGTPSTARFVLKGVTFTPSHYLSETQLQAIVQPRVGKPVSYDDLQAIAGEINALYRQLNLLTARAILPPQRISEGIVRIDLVEGKLGRVSVEGNAAMRQSWIGDWLGLTPEQPLDTRELERRLELFNHVNDTRLDARLRPGETFGHTDLLVQAQEPPRYRLRLFADNEAAPSIGRNEVGFNGAINNLLGLGDRLGVFYTHSSGVDSGALDYSLPVNRQGGRIGLSVSSLLSHVTSGPYKDFDVRGRSRNAQIQFSQPVARLGAWWLDGTLAGGVSSSTNELLGASLGERKVRSLSAGLSALGLYDTATLNASLTGKYNWIDSDIEGTRHAMLWQLSGSWVQRLTDNQFTVARLGAQFANTPLLSSTLAMQMGGSGTVRGYDLGAIAGDNGYYGNLEWHYRLHPQVTGFVFADDGRVRTRGVESQHISSVGLGLDVDLTHGVTLNLTAARTSNIVVPDQSRTRITARLVWQVL